MRGKSILQMACAAALLAATNQFASAIDGRGAPEVLDTRDKMPGEGYLNFSVLPGAGQFGEEWTGWVDIRHPAMDGTTNTFTPYDRSNRKVDVHTVTAIANDAAMTSAMPQIQRDFDFSNKIYAQAGISMIHEGNQTVKLDGTNGTFNLPAWPIDQAAQDDALKALKRSANAKTVNAYYVQKYNGTMPNGLTSPPAGYGANMPRNDGSGVADQAVSSTFGHEVGHMLLNGPALWMQDAVVSESNDPKNWMYKTGSSFQMKDVSWTKARIEQVQAARLFENGGANNPGFVQNDNLFGWHRYGDKVDWDFVVDHKSLEGVANGADNHSGGDGLYFSIGSNSTGGPETDHNHTGLGNFGDPGGFQGPSFRFADVFSLSLRYSDFDLNAAGELGLKEGALDYSLQFHGTDGSIVDGVPVVDFVFGWTTSTFADNYIVRWLSPIPADGVLINGIADAATRDGTAQIDAIIVSNVPEPAAAVLVLPALVLAQRRRCRQRM